MPSITRQGVLSTMFNRHTRRAAAVAVALSALGAGTAQAASVQPTVVDGNPTCADVQGSETWTEIKLDNPGKGEKNFGDAGVTGTLDIDDGVINASFTATPGVDAVIVKGGEVANVYAYTPDSTGDSGLTSPINPSTGEPYQVSHVQFCYGPDAPPSTPETPQNPPQTPPSTPPATPPAQQTAVPASPAAQSGVAGVVASARLRGPSGCVTRAFSARITGRGISKVTFLLDGRSLGTVSARNGGTLASKRVNPRPLRRGSHRLVARVTFRAGAGRVTRRMTFVRCAPVASRVPTFAG